MVAPYIFKEEKKVSNDHFRLYIPLKVMCEIAEKYGGRNPILQLKNREFDISRDYTPLGPTED